MKSKKTAGDKAVSRLRHEAEVLLNMTDVNRQNYEGRDIKSLFQELQVHQIELEMQNDELRIANEELELQQMKFIGMYDLAPIGYFILDRSGHIEEVNNAGMALTNAGKAGIISKKLERFVAPEHQEAYRAFFSKLIKSPNRQQGELKFISGTGREFYAELQGISVRASQQCYIALIDITERMTAAQILYETKERLELALEASATGTWELDLETMGFHLDKSIYRMCNINVDTYDHKYTSFLQYIHPDDQFKVDQHFRTAINNHQQIDLVCRFGNDTPQICYASIRGHIIERPGKNKRFIGIIMNITEKWRMEEESARLIKNQHLAITTATLYAEENERRRISEALHDSVSQLLYGIKIQLNQLPASKIISNSHIDDLLNIAIKETRNISFELAPSILTDFGLPATIDELAKRLSSPAMQIQTAVKGLSSRLDLLLETCIFRIIQELINNCMKHSDATAINVEVIKNKFIEIIVKDNGNGFNATELEQSPKGAGLSSIKNRISLYNGILSVESEPGQGTTIRVKLMKTKDKQVNV